MTAQQKPTVAPSPQPPPLRVVRQTRELTVGGYRIIKRLGQGGMGEVFEGLEPKIGKRVAIKVLRAHAAKDPDNVARFLTEARAVNAIGHRGIVDIFSFGQRADGCPYLVMELLEGMPFDRIVPLHGPTAPAQALGWAVEILEALGAAHAAGVVHRDVKPANLFWVTRGAGYVKLLDFGVAKLSRPLGPAAHTQASMVIGTPEYMAPEQLRGENASPASDLYSLGCVLFELISGRPLCKGGLADTIDTHLYKPVPELCGERKDLFPELDDLLQWMLEKKVEDRPASAAALLKEVRATLKLAQAHSPPTLSNPGHLRVQPAPLALAPPPPPPDSLTPLPSETVVARAPPAFARVAHTVRVPPPVSARAKRTRRRPRRWGMALALLVLLASGALGYRCAKAPPAWLAQTLARLHR